MQIKLSNLILVAIPILLIIVLLSAFFFINRNKTIPKRPVISTSLGNKIDINSSIPPYVVKPLPALDKEITGLGFWNKDNRLSSTHPRQFTVNVHYIDEVDPSNLPYTQADDQGHVLIGGSSKLDSGGNPQFDIFIDKKVLFLKNPPDWIDSTFWNLYYLYSVGPLSPDTQTFLAGVLSRGGYFSVKK